MREQDVDDLPEEYYDPSPDRDMEEVPPDSDFDSDEGEFTE